ncbi:alpha-L-fucosidase [Yeguia hominis]|uniref:Alpha-L-fucosidase n=1 Tax=Yeguia hominis TaxID=2763662 RepID=A0A926DBF9_9FIRM|nr:alpha-L-fucosidase [Yeguia hominis]
MAWYEKNYRRNLIDMHIEDWDDSFMASFDPEKYVAMLQKANVSCAMVYANSHVGYCYWPTKNGKMHPGLHGRDIFGEVVDRCHKAGMDVILYYTLIYDNWAYAQGPEWRILREDGKNSREVNGTSWVDINVGRYGVCCPNSTQYRDYVEKQLTELAHAYDFEGVFLDMTFWPDVCYCDHCKRRYETEVGGQMPRVVDWSDPVWTRFQEKREEWLIEFQTFATGVLKREKPGVSTNHQFSTVTQGWVRGVSEKHRLACDYVGGDFYAGLPEQSFICKLFYSMTGSYEFHTSRCTDLRDHTTNKSKSALEQQAAIALAHNGAFLFIDAIDPTGTLNPAVYETVGPIFKNFERHEPFLGGKMCQDVAVYFDLNSKMSFENNGKPVLACSQMRPDMPHLTAAVGAARIFKEAHVPYGVVSKHNFKDALDKYQVIVLPNVLQLQADAAEDLRRYVRKGGCVYASGYTSTALLGDVFGVEKIGLTKEDITYIAPTAAGQTLLPMGSEKYPIAVCDQQQLVTAAADATVLATTTLPYTVPSDHSKFASIHSDPPGIPLENPAVVLHSYGKGRVIWTAAPLESMGQESQDQAVLSLVRSLLGKPCAFSMEAPPAVEAVEFWQEDHDRAIVTLINLQTLTPPVPVHDIRLTVNLNGKTLKRACLLPDCVPVEAEIRDGTATVSMPPLAIEQMIAFEFEPAGKA